MKTNDDRQEVATTLRELRHRTYYREEIVESICDAISIADPVNTFREPEDVYKLLADLIDPTCETCDMDTGEPAEHECREHIMYCMACGCAYGHVLYNEDGDVWMDEAPRYCPNCGARVVSGDE